MEKKIFWDYFFPQKILHIMFIMYFMGANNGEQDSLTWHIMRQWNVFNSSKYFHLYQTINFVAFRYIKTSKIKYSQRRTIIIVIALITYKGRIKCRVRYWKVSECPLEGSRLASFRGRGSWRRKWRGDMGKYIYSGLDCCVENVLKCQGLLPPLPSIQLYCGFSSCPFCAVYRSTAVVRSKWTWLSLANYIQKSCAFQKAHSLPTAFPARAIIGALSACECSEGQNVCGSQFQVKQDKTKRSLQYDYTIQIKWVFFCMLQLAITFHINFYLKNNICFLFIKKKRKPEI